MMTDKDTARQQIARLVDKYQRLSGKERKAYDESNTCKDFILPMFRALGWDIENRSEVQSERREDTKRVDYAFYLNGVRVFYLEAKKLSEDVSKHIGQAINYAWLGSITWAVLSNFEHTRVFIAEELPEKGKEEQARFRPDLSCQEYSDYFDELWLLSKPAMQARQLDREAERAGKKAVRRPLTVDQVLLQQLIEWREFLINEFSLVNSGSSYAAIDNAVQRLIDRLIFIRTMEDRSVEKERKLQEITRQSRSNLLPNLRTRFRELDKIYNSNLFADSTFDHLDFFNIDFLRRMIDGLYNIPTTYARYDFSAISADVLGRVYEQYLGFRAQTAKQKHLDRRKSQASQLELPLFSAKPLDLEIKKRKRKLHGIFYTPQFVVRHIIQATLGKLLESGVNPHSLRILDPACGSGSFLIEAFDLLDRYLEAVEPDVPPHERRIGILSENLYGVDLDEQAVEITRLNLLLRAAYKSARLPPLNNIRVGNTLIDDESVVKEEAFNWDERFPKVMDAGGFDVIIGNPPYVRIQTLPHEQVEWMKDRYQSATASYDLYVPFVERGLSLLKEQGLMGYILPHKFFNAKYGQNLRGLIAEGKHLTEVVHFGDQQVFGDATTYTCILALSKKPQQSFRFTQVDDLSGWIEGNGALTGVLDTAKVSQGEWYFRALLENGLFERLSAFPVKLRDITLRIAQGIRTSANKVYVLKTQGDLGNNLVTAYSESLGRVVKIERSAVLSFLKGREIDPYSISSSGWIVIVPYSLEHGKTRLFSEDYLAENMPNLYAYLQENRDVLESRERGRMHGSNWYGYVYPKNLEIMLNQKLLVPDIANHASFALDYKGQYAFTSGYGIVLKPEIKEDYRYVLGLVNSRLLDFYVKRISTSLRGGFFRYFTQYIS